MACRGCFGLCPSGNFWIKLIFIIHFLLLNCHWASTHDANAAMIYNNTFLFLALLGSLYAARRVHLLQLAAMIEISCIFFDLYLLNYQYIDEWKDRKMIPFEVNLVIRVIAFVFLSFIASHAACKEKDENVANLRRHDSGARYLAMKNYHNDNNNNYEDLVESSGDTKSKNSSKRLIDKVTEV